MECVVYKFVVMQGKMRGRDLNRHETPTKASYILYVSLSLFLNSLNYRAGNCDMGRYNSTIGKNWLPPMLADTSRCGPNCPRHIVGGVHTACY